MSHSRKRRTQGVHHAGLTVPDLTAARGFFEQALGFDAVGEVPAYPGPRWWHDSLSSKGSAVPWPTRMRFPKRKRTSSERP